MCVVPRSGCKSMEVLQLSQVKISDRGMQHLLYQPLEQLSELDLSNTLITSRTLALLPKGRLHHSLSLQNYTLLLSSPLPAFFTRGWGVVNVIFVNSAPIIQ